MIVRCPGWVQERVLRSAGLDANREKLPDGVRLDCGAPTRESAPVVVIPVVSIMDEFGPQTMRLGSVNPGLSFGCC